MNKLDISRRTDYACRIIRAASKRDSGYVSIATIAEEEQIPYAFARSIQHDLTVAGFITTARGARGGLALKCDLKTTTLLEVIEHLQGPVSVSECSRDLSKCEFQPQCAFTRAFQGADALLIAYLGSITLHDLFTLRGSHPVIKAARSVRPNDMESIYKVLGYEEEPVDLPAISEENQAE